MGFKNVLRWVTLLFLPLSVIGILVGSLFRIQHWEGGRMLLTLGALVMFFAMACAILYAALVKPQKPRLPQFEFERKQTDERTPNTL